jgi:hypothetical protein
VCAETTQQRKRRILHKYPPLVNHLYYFGDYLVMRVLPKLPPFRKVWTSLTKGKSLVMSRTEIMGRLCAAGFAIGTRSQQWGVLHFRRKKGSAPRQ